MTTVTTYVGFETRIPDGPAVTGTLKGDRWVLDWKGKYADDRMIYEGSDQAGAVELASAIAHKLNELEPARKAYEQARRDFAAWLKERGME